MAKLENKIVLVTGAGSGVGLASAKLLLEEGAKLALAGRDPKKLDQAAASLGGGNRVLTIPTDVTDYPQVVALVKKATEHFGRIDILLNNAGVNIKARRMRELSVEGWNQLVRTNLDGAFYCIKEVLPQMIARKDGVIININSVSGKRAYPLAGGGYAASKFGLHALAGCLASEEMESNIRVSSIYPGEIDTPILDQRPTLLTPEQRAKILKPEDVATAVLFVATLPAHVSIPELIIKPTAAQYF